MAPSFFSLTNMLLATSFLFALTTAVPIPKSLDVESDNMLLHPTRDMWSEVIAMRPRFSPLDNLRIGTTVLPSGQIKEPILRRSPAENSRLGPRSDEWMKASFDPNEGVKMDKLKKRFFLAPHWRVGTVVPTTANPGPQIVKREDVGTVRGPATPVLEDEPISPEPAVAHPRIGGAVMSGDENPDDGDFSKKSEISTEITHDSKDGVASRDAKIENSPIGPTKLYSGSLWRRSLKHDVVAFA
jgi:hypothetical protein